jgi:Zn-dependent peptidase ImmA (M78 family)
MTARQRRQAWWYAQTLYELMASMAAQTEYPAPRLPQLAGDPVAAAQRTREVLGLAPDQPIGPLIRTLERGGVWVVAIPVALPQRDACSAWTGEDASTPVIVVAATTTGDRRRFSVAHELGHLVLHQVPEGSAHELERQADVFAEAFLLPAAAMCEVLVPPITLTTLADLKVRWGVSLQALIRRARTLECLTPSQYRSLSAQLGARGWRTQEPIAVPVERPRALRQLAELLYGRPIRAVPLADAMGLAPSFVQDLLEAHAPGEDEPHTIPPDHARR